MVGMRTARDAYKARYTFAVNRFRRVVTMLQISFIIMLLLLGLIIYMIWSKSPVRYYATSSIGPLVRLQSFPSQRVAQNHPLKQANKKG